MLLPKKAKTALALVLLMMAALVLPTGAQVQASTSPGSASWWDPSYPYRVAIDLTNPYNHTLFDTPVLIKVSFPELHLPDAQSGLTLRMENGTEVPSFVVDESKSGGFVTSVWLLIMAREGPSTVQEFWLYYGNLMSKTPSYRIEVQGLGYSSGLMSVSQQSSGPGSHFYRYSYGRTFSENILSRVSYMLQGQQQFGTVEISASPLVLADSWRLIANDTSVPMIATAVASSAPGLRVIQVDTLSGNTVQTNYLIENSGQEALDSVSLVNLLDSSQLASLAPATTSFIASKGTVVTHVESAYIGFEGNAIPTVHGVGPAGQIINQTKQDFYNLQDQSFGQAGAALSWSLGTLVPGKVVRFTEAWAVSPSPSSLSLSLQAALESLSVALGQEQTVDSLIPTANVYWNANLSMNGSLLGARGLSFPLTIHGGTWLAGSASFSGTVSYVTPAPDFTPAHASVWTPASTAVGNATASSSPSFWSVQDSAYVGRVAVSTSTSNSTASASVVSSRQTLVGGPSKNLTLLYKADFAGSGNSSAQSFLFEVDLDHSLSGVYDQSLILPVLGTSTSATCASGPKASTPPPGVQVSSYLVADGTWRSVTVFLGRPPSSLGVGFQVKFCASITSGFTGIMQLEVARAAVKITTDADGLITPVVNSKVPTASIQAGPSSPFLPSEAKITGNLSFIVASSTSLNLQVGSTFTAQPSLSPTIRLNATSVGVGISSKALGVLIATPYSTLHPSIFLNGIRAPSSSIGNDSVFAAGGDVADAWNNPKASATISVSFAGYRLSVSVVDLNGNPVPGANVTAYAKSLSKAGTNLTGASGFASLRLVPSSYKLIVTLQGSLVASGSTDLNQSSSESFRASVIKTTLRVSDALGSPLGGLKVSAVGSKGSSPIVGLTNHSGEFAFQAPLGGVYHVEVTSAGTTYYDGDITVATNHGVIIIPTSYYPVHYIEEVVGGAAGVILILVGVFLFVRSRRVVLFRK